MSNTGAVSEFCQREASHPPLPLPPPPLKPPLVKDFHKYYISVWPQRLISYKLRPVVYGNRLTSSNQRLGSIKFCPLELDHSDTDLSQVQYNFKFLVGNFEKLICNLSLMQGEYLTKLLLIGLKWRFCIWCMRAMFLLCLKHTFYLLWPVPFLHIF